MSAAARSHFNQFDDLTADEFAALLRIAKLSPEDKEIATQCIVWRMPLIDIGANVNMDRTTVSRRLQRVIIPELDRMLARMNKQQEKAGA